MEKVNETLLAEMQAEASRRQRTTDFAEFKDPIKEMMRLNISLPIVLGWLIKEGKKTTLPALRRYVVREFGEKNYEDYVIRNGWKKTKRTKNEVGTLNNYEASFFVKNNANYVNNRETSDVKIDAEGGVSEIHKILSAPPSKYPPRKK